MAKTNLLRVTQMDAVHLDSEIYKILLNLVKQCSAYLPPGFTAPYEPELHLLVKLLILNSSILKNGNTFGQKLLAIKYDNISTTKKVLYSVFSTFDYFKYRFEMLPMFRDTYNSMIKIDAIVKVCSFINLSIFLKSGTKPLLLERVLGLEQVYARENVQRQFGSKYLTRELLWNGFIELLVYILPLINYHKIKRIVRNTNPFYRKLVFSRSENRTMTVRTCCAHCAKPPILPYHMGCAHIFCYTCLKGNQMADSKYECPVCEFNSLETICERVAVN